MKKLLLLVAAIGCLAFTGCSKDDDSNAKLSKTLYSISHGDTANIQGTNVSKLSWNSENEFVATIKNGVITGQFVGRTIIKSTTDNLAFSVEVNPKYHTYEEPVLDWGASISAVKAKCGTPYSETSTSLIYQTTNTNAPLVLYVFQNGGLYTCGVVCKVSVVSTLVDFLAERYLPVKVDTDNYSATFMHGYGKISAPQFDYGVAMQYNKSLGGIMVAYTKVSDGTRGGSHVDFENVFSALENAMK